MMVMITVGGWKGKVISDFKTREGTQASLACTNTEYSSDGCSEFPGAVHLVQLTTLEPPAMLLPVVTSSSPQRTSKNVHFTPKKHTNTTSTSPWLCWR